MFRFQISEEQIAVAVPSALSAEAAPLLAAAEPLLPQPHPQPQERHLGKFDHFPAGGTRLATSDIA